MGTRDLNSSSNEASDTDESITDVYETDKNQEGGRDFEVQSNGRDEAIYISSRRARFCSVVYVHKHACEIFPRITGSRNGYEICTTSMRCTVRRDYLCDIHTGTWIVCKVFTPVSSVQLAQFYIPARNVCGVYHPVPQHLDPM